VGFEPLNEERGFTSYVEWEWMGTIGEAQHRLSIWPSSRESRHEFGPQPDQREGRLRRCACRSNRLYRWLCHELFRAIFH